MEPQDITAILVLYQTSPADSSSLQSLNHSCKKAAICLRLYVYDNSPQPQSWTDYDHLELQGFFHNPNNPGVSAAYNHFAHQLKGSSQWLLLLDQDTHFPESYCGELMSFEPPASLALVLPRLYQNDTLISPHAFRWGYSYSFSGLASGFHLLRGTSALNSGMLLRTKAFIDAGGYPGDVPLYFSDQVFIYRLKRAAVKQFYLLESRCRHSMSSNDSSEATAFKQRFKLFVEGASGARRHFDLLSKLGLSLVVLLRGLKLWLRMREFYFLKTALHILRK